MTDDFKPNKLPFMTVAEEGDALSALEDYIYAAEEAMEREKAAKKVNVVVEKSPYGFLMFSKGVK